MTVIRPVLSPIVVEEILTAPAIHARHMRTSCGHSLADYERFLRIEDAAGDVLLFCSACMLLIQGGHLRLVEP